MPNQRALLYCNRLFFGWASAVLDWDERSYYYLPFGFLAGQFQSFGSQWLISITPSAWMISHCPHRLLPVPEARAPRNSVKATAHADHEHHRGQIPTSCTSASREDYVSSALCHLIGGSPCSVLLVPMCICWREVMTVTNVSHLSFWTPKCCGRTSIECCCCAQECFANKGEILMTWRWDITGRQCSLFSEQ